MPQQTDLHGYTIPTRDEVDAEDRDVWGLILNTFFDEELETDIPLAGPATDRPAAAEYPGLWYLVTDSPNTATGLELTRSDGSDYQILASLNAQTLEGFDSSDFGVLADAETATGIWDFSNGVHAGGSPVLTEADMGAGAGLDADTIDGLSSEQFLRSDIDDTTTGRLTTAALQTAELNGALTGNVALTGVTGTNLGIDANGILNATDTNTQRSDEAIQDVLSSTLVGSGATTVSYDDTANALTIASTDTDTRVNVSEDGTTLVENVTEISFRSWLTAYDNGDGSVTIDSSNNHADIADDGIQIEASVGTLDFGTNLTATADGTGTVTVDASGGGGGGGSAIITSGTVTLSGGQATVATGVTRPLTIELDPSNGGTNTVDVDVVASARYDATAGENIVEITEDSTAVGNPTVAYRITEAS